MIEHTTAAAEFGATLGAYLVGHHVADYWVQTDHQAQHKGLPGWAGRISCASHVLTYTLTLVVCLAAVTWWLRLPVSPAWAATGLGVSAATHYWADRRSTLMWLADRLSKGGFYRRGEGLASGAAHLDQSWHWLWLGIAALVTVGH
ncbi:transcriptional regulator [Nocardia sp. CY41]|uniref:transcriptional regulator n=1 Tax=Nocardia sp. CY41 TaxID=2608686 RepID=UPI00135A47A7|nr:transcriptional regulator [Nocardia sp. CY41]